MKKTNFEHARDYGYEVPPRSRYELTCDANEIHKLVGYKGKSPFPIMPFVERVLPELYEGFDLQVVEPKELGEKFGETYPNKHVIKLREDVYDAAVAGQPLARMTVAHETGHLFEHEHIPLALARKEATKAIPAFCSSEWQANAFAGALLMPADKIIDLTPSQICMLYNVTITAANTQLKAIRERGSKWARRLKI